MSGSTPKLHVRIIATTDLHAHLAPFDYFRDAADHAVGLASAGLLIREAREEAVNTLFFDNGDLLQGGPLGDVIAAGGGAQGDHPMVRMLSSLGCDAATPGNHDFDFGLDYLRSAASSASFPFVTSNVMTADGASLFADHLLLGRDFLDESGEPHRLTVGVIGLLPPQTALWNKLHLDGRAEIGDMVEAARRIIPALRERCDILVALCHTGISRRPARPGDENAALAVAGLGGIDAMVIGHQHLLFPGGPDFRDLAQVDVTAGTLSNVPAVMPGFAGGHVGVIDLHLQKEAGAWRRRSARSHLRTAAGGLGSLTDSGPNEAVHEAHQATLAYVRRPVGRVSHAVTSHFGLIADCGAVQIVNDAQRWFVTGMSDSLGLGGLPVLSACAPFRCGGRGGPSNYTSVAVGPVTLRDVADIYPYPNTLCVLRVTGAVLRDWLEKSACLYKTIDPSRLDAQDLIEPTFPSFDFDVIDGIEYTIDVTQPPRFDLSGSLISPDNRRVSTASFAGSPLRDDQEFLVATNSYRAFGGGSFPGVDGSNVAFVAADACRDVLSRYISAFPDVDGRPDGNWRLAPLPSGVTARFLSARDAPRSGAFLKVAETANGFGVFEVSSAG